MVIISGTYTNLQTFCEMWPILWNIKSEWLEITPMHATEINVHTNRHKHSKNRARFNTITTRSTVVNDRCMESFQQSHNTATCGLLLQLCKWQKFKNTSWKFQNIFRKCPKFYQFSRINSHPLLLKTNDEILTGIW